MNQANTGPKNENLSKWRNTKEIKNKNSNFDVKLFWNGKVAKFGLLDIKLGFFEIYLE